MDETYHGDKDVVTKRTKRGLSGHSSKRSIVALVERGGEVRTFHVDRADKPTINAIIAKNIARGAHLNTDESRLYSDAHAHVAKHSTVNHTGAEYVRYESDATIHSNTVENVFSVFKRGMKGTYQHCGEKHLHRYLAEFDFRYNNRVARGVNDIGRTDALIKGVVGKRLTYKTAN
jgi:hypothetical protein